MSWVRIDENAMEHPKIGGLPDGAFRLWVQALAYCQKFLTDGAVNVVALKGLRAYSSQRRAVLVTVGLWDEVSDGSVRVHDFLDWNESRAAVVQARQDSKERRDRWRRRHASLDAVPGASPDASKTPSDVRGVVCSEEYSQLSEGGSGETVRRVQRFVDRYRELHEQYVGVAYLGNPQKDYQAACELVAVFDDGMLEAITVYGLNDPDPFMAKDTRTITKLKSRASGYAKELKAKRLA